MILTMTRKAARTTIRMVTQMAVRVALLRQRGNLQESSLRRTMCRSPPPNQL